MNELEPRELAFRLYLRNIEPAKIAQALAREHGYKVSPAKVTRWVAERLKQIGQDPQRAKIISAIAEANRELWTAAAAPGVTPTAKASFLQAVARNEERLLRIGSPAAADRAAIRYVPAARPGRCGAHGRAKQQAKLFCDEEPVEGRIRCRAHGGASPRAAAHPRFKTGMFSNGGAGLEIFTAPFAAAELRLIERWRRDPEEALRHQLAEGALVQNRAMRAGNVDIYARLGTMVATTARALVSLHEVPPPDDRLPQFIEAFEGKTAADFDRDLEVIRRDAAAGSAVAIR